MAIFKDQLKLALDTISGALQFFMSQGVRELLFESCKDEELRRSIERIYETTKQLRASCLGLPLKEELLLKLLDELERCNDIRCVRSLVNEYRAMLT